MRRRANTYPTIAAFILLLTAPLVHSQSVDDRIRSEHLRIRVPLEREWLGRDSIMDLERCWRFMNAATGDSLPRPILVVIDWNGADTSTNYQDFSIVVGMNQPSAAPDAKSFLFHNSAREMARLGLYVLSRGASARQENAFLVEGMSEILVHEYERNSRSLSGAWIISQQLDRMKLLGLNIQSAWASFSGGHHNLRTASPGITFLMTCRELHGRDRVLKLFESMRKGNLLESIAATFKTGPELLEAEWLKRVRSHQDPEEVTVTSDEDAPQLLKTASVPEACRAGSALQLRLFVKDGSNDLLPWGIFLLDEASGRVLQAQAGQEKGASYIAVSVPIEEGRKPGQYGYRIIAVDESGNVRNWRGKYTVASNDE
ncbi:MAG TPA: hypothetical protein VE398_04785 [Acidobacteriota bacterium]|nr:hypothetical protein [Acidobacteriota bacterium]